MSRLNRTKKAEISTRFIKDESGWADFFITRTGILLFAAILFLAAFRIYPLFQEDEKGLYLDTITGDIASKIETVDSISIPEYKYNYMINNKNINISIEISTEYITGHENLNENRKELMRAAPLITHVYPPNRFWNNTTAFRKYISGVSIGERNGDISSPLDFDDRGKIDAIFESIRGELAVKPFVPDLDKSIWIEKVIVYYKNYTENIERDYVFIYQ